MHSIRPPARALARGTHALRLAKSATLTTPATPATPVTPVSPAPPTNTTIPGLGLWLDCSVNSLTLGSNVPVAPDRSGNGRNCTFSGTGAATYQPWPNGTGLGALQCSGAMVYTVGGAPLTLTGPCAVIAVLSRAKTDSFFAISPSTGQSYGLGIYAGGYVEVGDSIGGNAVANYYGEGPQILQWYRDSTGWDFYGTGGTYRRFNGVLGPIDVQAFVHGTGTTGNDLLAELRIYTQSMESQQPAIINALSAKWSTPS